MTRLHVLHLLEDGDDVFEVPDVKDGHLELDVAKMSRAVDELALARGALGPFLSVVPMRVSRMPLGSGTR